MNWSDSLDHKTTASDSISRSVPPRLEHDYSTDSVNDCGSDRRLDVWYPARGQQAPSNRKISLSALTAWLLLSSVHHSLRSEKKVIVSHDIISCQILFCLEKTQFVMLQSSFICLCLFGMLVDFRYMSITFFYKPCLSVDSGPLSVYHNCLRFLTVHVNLKWLHYGWRC